MQDHHAALADGAANIGSVLTTHLDGAGLPALKLIMTRPNLLGQSWDLGIQLPRRMPGVALHSLGIQPRVG